MSISQKASLAILRAVEKAGLINPETGDLEQTIEEAREYHLRHRFTAPRDRKAHYREVRLAGYPCLLIRPRNKTINKNKSILYLHGGLRNEGKSEIPIARNFGKRIGVDVWYPIYPSVTEVPITKSIDVIYRTYRKMIKIYGGENIAVIGGAIGGLFAFQIVNQNNRHSDPVSMPGLLIAHSPGGIPASEEDWQIMRHYSEKDPLIGLSTVERLKDLAASYGEAVPHHAVSPIECDFHNAPETFVFYGEETCAGNASAYVRAYRRDDSGEKMHMHLEPGAMHRYALMSVFPESRRDYNRQIQLLRDFAGEK